MPAHASNACATWLAGILNLGCKASGAELFGVHFNIQMLTACGIMAQRAVTLP